MAVSGVSSSKSIYGNRNVLTGLASGLDTESMIENAISAYKNKITSLTQQRTKTEWKQESYRSMIDKMSSFLSKYTSYRSSNNLMSSSFFDQAVKTVSKGANKDMVSATGKASSDVRIDRVLQLASAATYKLSGSILDPSTAAFGESAVTAAALESMNLDDSMSIGSLQGTLTLAYGGANSTSHLSVRFDDSMTFVDEDGNPDPRKLVDEINKQLSEQSVSIGNNTYTGKDLLNNVVKAELSWDGSITFTDPKKNGVYVSGATGNVKENLLGGQEPSAETASQIRKLDVGMGALFTHEISKLDYLTEKGASLEITVDGKTKTIQVPGRDDIDGKLTGKDRDKAFVDALQKNIDDAFGPKKLTVSDKNGDQAGIQLQFDAPKGSTFSLSTTKGEVLGFGESGKVTSYLNTGKTLGELLGEDGFDDLEPVKVAVKDEDGKIVPGVYETDENGNPRYETDAQGNTLYSFKVNGKEIGKFSKETTLSTVFNTMNSNSDCGVKVGYSKLTNELTFTAKETGEASEIDFSDPESEEGASLAEKLFGKVDKSSKGYSKGQDAIFEATVNGTSLGEITRSSNSVEMDGMTVNLKGTFGYQTDENGQIKYEDSGKKSYSYERNDAGQIIFKATGSREVYGKERGDGTVELTSKGIDLTYKPTDETNPYAGAKVYGKFDEETGALNFYMKDKNGGNEKQVYLQQGNWFSTTKDFNGNPSVDFSTKVEAKPIMQPVKDKSAEGVTFETSSDADKIVDVVKQMVEDYNAMAREIKEAYSTLPAQRSNKQYYEPLTAEEEEGMTESAIKNWNEKAKQGILFGDRDLASLYQRLTSAVSMTGENGAALREAGITVSYSNGLSTLEFNETKFRAALNDDPDKVRDAFTASVDSGAKSNGLMQALKQPLDAFGKTEGGKGALVEKAGSPLAPSTMYNNSIQKELNRIDEEIDRWQDKMEDQIDSYTSQFSRLEQLVQQMNSQSSYFSQLMGG